VKDDSYRSIDYSNYDNIEEKASMELDQTDNYTD
jgi:hypothetical protein